MKWSGRDPVLSLRSERWLSTKSLPKRMFKTFYSLKPAKLAVRGELNWSTWCLEYSGCLASGVIVYNRVSFRCKRNWSIADRHFVGSKIVGGLGARLGFPCFCVAAKRLNSAETYKHAPWAMSIEMVITTSEKIQGWFIIIYSWSYLIWTTQHYFKLFLGKVSMRQSQDSDSSLKICWIILHWWPANSM